MFQNLPGRRLSQLAKDVGVMAPLAESVDAVDKHKSFMLKEREPQVNVGGGMSRY